MSSTFDLQSEKFQTMGKMRVGWFNVVQVSVSNTYIHFFPSMWTGPLVGSLGSLRSAPSARQFFFALHSTMKPVHMLTWIQTELSISYMYYKQWPYNLTSRYLNFLARVQGDIFLSVSRSWSAKNHFMYFHFMYFLILFYPCWRGSLILHGRLVSLNSVNFYPFRSTKAVAWKRIYSYWQVLILYWNDKIN